MKKWHKILIAALLSMAILSGLAVYSFDWLCVGGRKKGLETPKDAGSVSSSLFGLKSVVNVPGNPMVCKWELVHMVPMDNTVKYPPPMKSVTVASMTYKDHAMRESALADLKTITKDTVWLPDKCTSSIIPEWLSRSLEKGFGRLVVSDKAQLRCFETSSAGPRGKMFGIAIAPADGAEMVLFVASEGVRISTAQLE